MYFGSRHALEINLSFPFPTPFNLKKLLWQPGLGVDEPTSCHVGQSETEGGQDE